MILAIMAATGLLSVPAAAEPAHPVECVYIPSSDNTQKEQDQAERWCLAQLRGIAERSGPALRLKLENGAWKTLTDVTSGCERQDYSRCYFHHLVAYRMAEHTFVVDVHYDEGGTVLLISSRTGHNVSVSTVPHYSPSGRYLVSVDATELGGRDYDIALLSSGNDPAKVEWQYSTPKGEPYEA
jgi:hypothetical protein